jgi:hypothetical protein
MTMWRRVRTALTPTKVREHKTTSFDPGTLPAVLAAIAVVVFYLLRDGLPRWAADWFVSMQINVPSKITTQIFGIATIAVAGTAALILATKRRRLTQAARDAESTGPGRHVLFLRPFFTDAKLHVQNPYASPYTIDPLEPHLILPEEFIARVLEPYYTVRQIGGHKQTFGPGRLEASDSEWKRVFTAAVEVAEAIVIIPLINVRRRSCESPSGTAMLWEFRYLAESGHLRRTVVVMPIVHLFHRRATRRGWDAARQEAAKFKVNLPDYSRAGAALTFAQIDDQWRVQNNHVDRTFSRHRLALGLLAGLAAVKGVRQFART